MMRTRGWLKLAAILAVIAVAALGAAIYVMAPKSTAEMRGYRLAENLGCHGCHGPRGTGGVPNPRSDEAEVPAWDGGTAMMYVQNEDEIREWILDGMPRRLMQEHAGHEHGGASLPIGMPAYRSVVDDDELEDLVAYYKAVAVWDEMTDGARRGYKVAFERGCFGCHGPGGMIGVANPRSFKGYIPPWRGADFAELVKNDDELRAWIRDGSIPRLESNPMARFFMRRQIVRMPAYRDILTDDEISDIVEYVNWLRGENHEQQTINR